MNNSNPQLPFSSVASLNGVSMFSKCQDVILQNTRVQNGVIQWKEFLGSITLIGIASGGLESDLQALLSAVFNAMVMFVGKDELQNPRNLERLKRDLRPCYPLVDRLMESLDSQSASAPHPTLLLNAVEAILCPESQSLEAVLESFTSRMGSVFGCLCVWGRYVCGTTGWRSLSPQERQLLLRLISLDTEASLRDTPVYLCHRSPNALDVHTCLYFFNAHFKQKHMRIHTPEQVAFRAVICKLLSDVHVIVICGPTPALPEVDDIVLNCWQQHSDTLKTARQCYPRNFPSSVQFPSGVLGAMVVNWEEQKYVISRSVQPAGGRRALSGAHRLDILRTFYLQAVQDFCMDINEAAELNLPEQAANEQNNIKERSENISNMMETYWCSEYHKCHAYRHEENVCCVLYASVVPMSTMRLITKKILQDILSDKNISW